MRDQAVPFALGALLSLTGAVATLFVSQRAVEFASSDEGKSANLGAGSVHPVTIWAIDAGQSFVIAVAPGFTALTLIHIDTAELGCGYALMSLIGLGLFGWVLYQPMDRYARTLGQDRVTVVPLVGLTFNAIFGLLAQLVF